MSPSHDSSDEMDEKNKSDEHANFKCNELNSTNEKMPDNLPYTYIVTCTLYKTALFSTKYL